MVSKENAIGIFDSGIGGLTVAKAISNLLPKEKIIYFGDTLHLPYGDKSKESIIKYSLRIVDFLLQKNVKIIVIACNSISSHAYDLIKKKLDDQVLLVDVIRPAVDYIISSGFQNTGIIGTKATINSNIHRQLMEEKQQDLTLHTLATPLLVPMIEEGFFNNQISNSIIHKYLSYPDFENIDALLLACTHYPLIKKEIEDFLGDNIEIIDNAELVAAIVKQQLQERDLLVAKRVGPDEFYVSDYTHSFEQTAKLFFGKEIQITKIDI